MRVVGIGANVCHTLIAITRETARHTAVREIRYDGGVKLVFDLISKVLPDSVTALEFFPLNSEIIRTFTQCRQYPIHQSDNAGEEKKEVWRISDNIAQTEHKYDQQLKIGETSDSLLLVEIPQALGQSVDAVSLINNKIAGKTQNGWAVVKTETLEYIGSKLHHSLHKLYGNRHIIIMSINTLRSMNKGPLISSLSWESTAEAIQVALVQKLKGSEDKLPYAVIVSILNDGAAYFRFDPASNDWRLTLIYDPLSIEGLWAKPRLGRMAGYTQCITAAVTAAVASNSTDHIEDYIIAGIHGGRKLHEIGFKLDEQPHFPTDDVAEQIKTWITNKNGEPFKKITIPAKDEVNWSIVKQSFLPDNSSLEEVKEWANIQQKMFELVKGGILKANPAVPVVEFDKLTAVLREEIEELRAIYSLMQEYSSRVSNKRPLSIAVFGWPGTGKSFAVKSVAKSISRTRRRFEILEFNLSQFSVPDQLYEALHQVRDSALSGKMPLVFWDEFDCDFHGQYGWLRYFLAPMQDGKFTQGQVTHSVGDAVFVFAGGTSNDMQTFRKHAETAPAAKGPDFLSRLHGFLNIPSLDHGDTLLVGVLIRRAILLRGLLKEYAPEIVKEGFDIDESVMAAFLCLSKFRYGARSMQAILSMSSLYGKNRFEPSSLPPLGQIDLHVDSSEWLLVLEGASKLMIGPADSKYPLIGW